MSTDPPRPPGPVGLRGISRRHLLASPLLLWWGKLFAARPAPGQEVDSHRPSDRGARRAPDPGDIPQSGIDAFDESFLPPADLRLALVADTHTDKRRDWTPPSAETFAPELLGARGRNDLNDSRTAKVYAQLKASRPEFMIHLGDLVHGYPQERTWKIQVDKANRLLEQLEMPAYLVPGNHDIGNKPTIPMPGPTWPGAPEDPRDAYYVSDANIKIFERDFGPSFFHFESAGSLFLILNAYAFNTGLESEARQWRWLEETLAARRDVANVFIAMHPLPYWGRIDEPGAGNYEVVDEPARSRLLAFCTEYDVRAVFAGHIHHDHVRYHGSTLVTGVPSTAFSRDNWGLYYPLAAPTWDSARSAYCQVRVRGRRVVRQLIRTVDLLSAVTPCQQGNSHPPRRLMARQTADGVAGPIAVTVPLMREHPGLGAPENAISDRHRGAKRADELRVAWISGKSGRGGHWLQVALARPQRISRIVVQAGMRSAFRDQLELRPDGGAWFSAASGTVEAPRGDRPPPAIEHRIQDVEAADVRLRVPNASRKVSVRRLEIFNSEGTELTALPGFTRVFASSAEREVRILNTAAFTQAFDLNPSYIRLAPRSTALAAVSPLPGLFSVDPFLVESARHARRQGANLWAVASMSPDGGRQRAIRSDDIATYCKTLAEAFQGADVQPIWEIDGDQRQVQMAMSAFGKARFAAPAGLMPSGADFAVAGVDSAVARPRQPTLLHHPPFPSRREGELAASLARWLARWLASEHIIPCVSLLGGEGLLDGWDNPMPAFYVVRAFNTVLAGAERSRPHCRAVTGLETVHFSSAAGRLIVATSDSPQAPKTIRPRGEVTRAWWIDPVTSSSRELVITGRELRGLLFPDYPVILRLA